ncbi:GATOR complex protein Iml1-like isoform X2 [Littorina saxatilis]|uniref:GATOR complex protein Iml1-like isoform X2 n=1 Tax=Littorina saxatilis TaxID=31220 RepID=UPI0038B50B9C
MSKTFKLWVHRSNPNQKDLLITAKDFPGVQIGDVLEIYHPEEEFSRLLLQVESIPEDFQQKDTVSIADSIATTFHLQRLKDVIVNKIEPKNVALDMVELLFKEQYLHRSDMWRLMKTLKNTCVYLNKKIEFAEIRCMVNEMWSKGEKVLSGVITGDTRVVYRSSTAVVQIFIQMSSEMWEFDLNGDLYFEKAVNGFLTDLFAKWKDQNSCHDVTIVLFSRTFYDSQSLDDFPPDIRECLQVDDFGNIYEDFYRVIVQNERYEEWNNILCRLRKLFNSYRDYVLCYHQQQWPNWNIPPARNSTAAQGNFLETLNMSLNLFENYYLDRNFDRTGKVSVVITPGPGVFEVDRELTFITKQRTIDCGVGSDLVCMGEQPLHAVPLFKFRSKNVRSSIEVGDDYNIPHWMNHSFYTSKSQIQNQQNAAFVPRIKPPPEFMKMMEKSPPTILDMVKSQYRADGDDDNFPFVDYDEYDAQVFKLPSRTPNRSLRSASCYGLKCGNTRRMPQSFSEARRMCGPRTRHISEDVMALAPESSEKKSKISSSAISIPSPTSIMDDVPNSVGCYPILEKTHSRESFDSSGSEDMQYQRPVVGSAGSPVGHSRTMSGFHRNRALINPFAPSRLQFKMTSNRRRWVHALPTDAKGVTVQPHHVQTSSSAVSQEAEEYTWSTPAPEVVQAAQLAVEARRHKSFSMAFSAEGDASASEGEVPGVQGASPGIKSVMSNYSSSKQFNTGDITSAFQRSHATAQRLFNNLKEKYVPWAATGEQEWTPDLTTGTDWRPLDQNEANCVESRLVKPIFSPLFDSDDFCPGISVDWKSLTIPASLPITTDYFPDEKSLDYDYVIADYDLLPDDVNAEYWLRPIDDKGLSFYRRPPLTTHEVFRELISQRLGQGFQWIVKKTKMRSETSDAPVIPLSKAKGLMRSRHISEPEEEFYLSIGRIFHKLRLKGHTITVTRYWPRHPQPQRCVTYRYRFQAPDSYCYDASSTEFRNERLENYNWNYLDQYICTRGEGDYGLSDTLKYWRSRFFLLPTFNPATKKIVDGQSTRCDIYEEKSPAEIKTLISGFLRFLEILNKLKKSPQFRRSKVEGDTSPGKPEQESKDKEEKLTMSAPLVKIADAMLDTQIGLSFLQNQVGLPGNCFISAEAVMWVQQHISGAQSFANAMKIMKGLLEEGLILHASGNAKHKFIFGFYLFYFTYSKAKSEAHVVHPDYSYNTLFQNEWLEVSILHSPAVDEGEGEQGGGKFFLPASTDSPERELEPTPPPTFSPFNVVEDWREQTGWSKQGWGQQSATLQHKYVNVDVNPSGKSERQEWATARYNAYYSPLCAFELQIQWMVATGSLLGDMIYSFARKATTNGFHLIPVPVDPFALPECINSDPLRGPIFISLLLGLEDRAFSGCAEDAKQERLLMIQDAILKRFGFVRCSVVQPNTQVPRTSMTRNAADLDANDYKHQYVHCTVGMFVLVPEVKSSPLPPPPPAPAPKYPLPPVVQLKYPPSPTASAAYLGKRSSSDLHKDYIARQHSNMKHEQHHRVGFLWSWNFMSSKRWRSGNTGSEEFQDKMLADFRKFCGGKDGRLEEFLQDYIP